MASIIKQTILDALTKVRGIGGVNWAAVWNDQLNRMDDQSGLSLPFPAIYVEMLPQEWNMLSAGVSQCDIVWKIHICHQQFDSMDGFFDQNLDVFDLRDSVKTALMLFKPTNCGSWIASGEEQDYSHTNIYHYILEFTCCFIDTKGSGFDPTNGWYIYSTPPTDLIINVVIPHPNVHIFNSVFSRIFA